VFFLDFASSIKASDVADFQAKCGAELAALDEVLTRDSDEADGQTTT
jgi:hypothetical protein